MGARRNVAAARCAVAYCRVSLEEQARNGLSLEDQESKARAYCNLVGFELVEVVHDPGVSGSKRLGRRPGGAQLLKLLSSGASDVVAIKLDRLFRNAADCLTNVEDWDRAGVGLHLIDFGGQAVNTRTAAGRLFITMLAGFAAFERDLIAERTASALAFRRASGRSYSRDPFGWRSSSGRLIPIQVEQEALLRIRTLRERGLSLRAIADVLNKEKVRPKRGRAWYASSVRSVLQQHDHGGDAQAPASRTS